MGPCSDGWSMVPQILSGRVHVCVCMCMCQVQIVQENSVLEMKKLKLEMREQSASPGTEGRRSFRRQLSTDTATQRCGYELWMILKSRLLGMVRLQKQWGSLHDICE